MLKTISMYHDSVGWLHILACNWSSGAKLASFRCLGTLLGSWEGWGLSLWLLMFWRQFESHSMQERAILNAHLSRFSSQLIGWCPVNWSKAKDHIQIPELEKEMAPLGRRDSSHTANGRVPRGEDGAHWTPLYQLTQRPAGGRLTQDAIRGATLLFLVVAVIPSRSSVQLTVTHRLQHTSFPCLSRSPGVSHTHVPRVDDAIQPLYPLLPPSPLALNLCQLQIFSNEMTFHIRWPKYWSFSYSISPSNEYSGLISFRIDWFDLLAIQGLSRVFSNTTVQRHQFFGAQVSL